MNHLLRGPEISEWASNDSMAASTGEKGLDLATEDVPRRDGRKPRETGRGSGEFFLKKSLLTKLFGG
jgi:hypothetical protein